ncbi:hypothetical protein [uncultured Tateyamaria sp.]|uniref:hypothetical protein n=1 Tax=Tateyamaria sp. 1078 TaxID=3417464 RepID=UPI0026392E9D|nr:hypothetical protein [uncultured Tateyamaria sp.]
MTTRIYAVDSVTMALQKSNPPNLVITAMGRTRTPLWSDPRLVAHVYVTEPQDGVQDFDFVATPPPQDVIVPQVLAPVTASAVIPEIDIENYWGADRPLAGVRCHAQSNAKTTLFHAPIGMPGCAEVLPEGGELSFAIDIRPLFRPVDIDMMIAVRNLDLGSHDAVTDHADVILARLRDGSMPCDGAWPATDVDLFERWISEGKTP